MPMEVKQVTEDSWIFQKPRRYSGYEFYDEHDDSTDEGIPLRLPPEVAKLGKKGMTISCMHLKCREGVWSPFDPYGDADQVCANVYSP
jgi:hypothetical protein